MNRIVYVNEHFNLFWFQFWLVTLFVTWLMIKLHEKEMKMSIMWHIDL